MRVDVPLLTAPLHDLQTALCMFLTRHGAPLLHVCLGTGYLRLQDQVFTRNMSTVVLRKGSDKVKC